MNRISILLVIIINLLAFQDKKNGSISGTIIDSETNETLVSASVIVVDSEIGTTTNLDGKFKISGLEVGAYKLKVSFVGYKTRIIPDVIVRVSRITDIKIAMTYHLEESEEVVVTASYFNEDKVQPVSINKYSAEEIRRAPGAAGDISRIIMGNPAVAKVNDQSNGLIVRGGSPIENQFYIDGIEVPNINHFPTQGVNSGPIGLINADLISGTEFYTGGFSAVYGNSLSSVVNITFRDGNKKEYDGQLDLNFSGFGAVLEGPLFVENSSFLLSFRKSYLDILVKSFDLGTTVAPRYGDAQLKLLFDISDKVRLSFLSIWANDYNSPDHKTAIENDMLAYGKQEINELTNGFNLRFLWSNKFYSNNSFSYSQTDFNEKLNETYRNVLLNDNRSTERRYIFKNTNFYQFNRSNSLEFGFELRKFEDDFYYEYQNNLLKRKFQRYSISAFTSYTVNLGKNILTVLGLRTKYNSYTKKTLVDPRLSLSWQIDPVLKLTASYGAYHQSFPNLILAQSQTKLHEQSVDHFIMALNYLITEDTKLSLEAYYKDYYDMLMDNNKKEFFMIDELLSGFGRFEFYNSLSNTGKAVSKGIELLLQKKLSNKLYGQISASFFNAKYKDLNGIWRDRVINNKYIFHIEGGYKLSQNWESSLRWIYAGGRPYTPFDQAESKAKNEAVLDLSRINKANYKDYHSLNLRVDRRFNFSGSNLVAYISIWNLYNRENVAEIFWNANKGKESRIKQWTVLPIFGLEYEF